MIIKLTFNNEINSSLQIGDVIFASPVSTLVSHVTSHILHTTVGSNQITIGTVVAIGNTTVKIDTMNSNGLDVTDVYNQLANNFISFAKNINVNETGLKGYYADVKLVNTSTKITELFSVSSEVAPSSK